MAVWRRSASLMLTNARIRSMPSSGPGKEEGVAAPRGYPFNGAEAIDVTYGSPKEPSSELLWLIEPPDRWRIAFRPPQRRKLHTDSEKRGLFNNDHIAGKIGGGRARA